MPLPWPQFIEHARVLHCDRVQSIVAHCSPVLVHLFYKLLKYKAPSWLCKKHFYYINFRFLKMFFFLSDLTHFSFFWSLQDSYLLECRSLSKSQGVSLTCLSTGQDYSREKSYFTLWAPGPPSASSSISSHIHGTVDKAWGYRWERLWESFGTSELFVFPLGQCTVMLLCWNIQTRTWKKNPFMEKPEKKKTDLCKVPGVKFLWNKNVCFFFPSSHFLFPTSVIVSFFSLMCS